MSTILIRRSRRGLAGPDGRDAPASALDWRRGVTRLPGHPADESRALRSVDGRKDVTPELVENLAIADFLHLDACYYLTHNVDQPRSDSLVVSCEHCAGRSVPLR